MAKITINKKALTLLEVLVACLMVILPVVTFSAATVWMRSAGVKDRYQVQAMDFAREIMEQLFLKAYDDAELSVGIHSDEPFLALPPSALRDKFSGVRSYEVETNDPEGKKITVETNWVKDGEAKQLELHGLVIP